MWSAGVADLWNRFKSLLPSSPVLVGTVTTLHGNGTCTVTMPGGGTVRVVGESVATGKKVFIKDGIVQGEAPDLPYYELEV